VQGVLAEQVLQLPPLQTMLVPHPIPGETLPVSMQTEVPELQTVVPVSQTFPFGVQGFPATQVRQLPPLQTRLVPQTVPFWRLVSWSTQVGVPLVQESNPV
jgi:hypothetical protein